MDDRPTPDEPGPDEPDARQYTDAAVGVNVPVVLRGTVVVLAGVWLAAGCADSDGGLLTADDDQNTVDEAIAAVEKSLRDDFVCHAR